jgi:class 3 adenylate cyclase/tetratricopeptide (TPR) repeat protein
MLICARCAQENPDVAKFCLACGALLAAPEPTSEERKLITVLFTDIVGSTAKAEQMDPEDVRARLAPYYVRLRRELERFGGTVEKFIGDAVVALFGAPAAHEDDPERAVRAAFAICDAIDELNAEDEWLDLKVRVGVNTGEALVVVGARASEGEGIAAGDVMNTAARLQSAAPVNGVLVGELTYAATRDVVEYQDAEPIAAKGKSEPVRVWEAVAVKEVDTAAAADGITFVGREREVAALEDVWRAALEARRPRLITIVGPPGIGKSRLLAEFARRAEQDGRVHWGRCLPYGEGITYWPVTELVKSAAGILQSDDRATIAEKLDAFLEALGTDDLDELRTIASALSNLIGIPTTPRGTYTASEISQAELHWGIRRTMQLLAAEHPTAFVLEDLHWAEPTLLELIGYILADETEAPLVLVGSARPDIADVAPAFLGDHGRRRTVELDTFDREQAVALLTDLLGDASLAETPFAAALIDNAGGNPLFLEETVRTLRDRGLVDAERWRNEDVGQLPVPTSVQGLISSRLDQLDPTEKRVAHHASVVGAVFWAGAVAHLAVEDGGPRPDPRPGLEALERRDFVAHSLASTVAGEEEYAFKHILMRDVAYGQVPKGRRAELHVRFSDWVTILPGSADEFVEIVAWHLEQACRLSREVARSPIEPPIVQAAGALANAARRAERRESLREAHRYYTRALDVVGDQHEELRLELRLRRADMAMMLGQLTEATDELLELAEGATRSGRTDIECEVLLLLGDIDQRQGRISDAHDRLVEAQTLAKASNNPHLEVRAAFVLATFIGDYEGEHEHAVENLRAVVAAAEEIDDRALVAEGHLRITALIMSHDFEGAERELRRCLEIASELGSHRIEAEATSWLGLVVYNRSRPDEGERLCLQARTWFERTGDTYFQVQNIILGLALFALADGRPDEAEEWLREALPVALQIGGWVVLETYRHLVSALVAQDRLDDAREIVAFAARSVPEEDMHARTLLLMAEATVATAAGESATASTAFAEALRLYEELDLPLDVAETRMALGRSLRAFGDVIGARTELERARAIFVRVGATTRRDAIDRELAELVEGPAPAGPSTVDAADGAPSRSSVRTNHR